MSGKFALIIGNSKYDDPTLRQLHAPDADVQVLADVLRDPAVGSFDVQTLVNESSQKENLMSKQSGEETVPAKMKPFYEAIVGLTDAVCKEHLNDEYAALSRQLAAALARKRPSPIERGKPETWACAVVYAIGTVNFLFDKSQTPHMRADELCAAFGVSASSGSAKAKLIRDMFDLFQFHPEWTLPSLVDRNPLVWMLSVNGMIEDIRYMPREAQEVAYLKGLIPYIPADHPERLPKRSR